MSLVLVGALAWKSVDMHKKRKQKKLEKATQKLDSSALRSSEEVQRAFAQADLSGFSEPSRFEATAQDPDDFAPPLPARNSSRPGQIIPVLPSTQYSAGTPYDVGNSPNPSPYSNSTPYDSANDLTALQDIIQHDLGPCDLDRNPSAPPPPYEIRDRLTLGYTSSPATRLTPSYQPQQSNSPAHYLEYIPGTPTLSLHGEESWAASQVELVPAPLRVHSTDSTEKIGLDDARDLLPSQRDRQSFRDSQGVWDGSGRLSATMTTIPSFTMEMEDTSPGGFAASTRNSRIGIEERWESGREISRLSAVGRPDLLDAELQVSNVEWRPTSSVYDEDFVGGVRVNGGEMERKLSYDVGDDGAMLA